MRRLLVVDFLCAEAHRMFNMNVVRALSDFSEVTLVSVNDYYNQNSEELRTLGVKVINYNYDLKKLSRYHAKLMIIKNIIFCGKLSKHKNYDFVIALAHDTILSLFIPFMFHGVRVGLFHHKNLDELKSYIKKRIFSLYKDKIYHFVFEDSFKKCLVNDYSVPETLVFSIPHPIAPRTIAERTISFDCIGLCHENDEFFLDRIEELSNEIVGKGLKFVFRSKNQRQSTKNITFIKGFLNYSDYEGIIASSKTVFVPLPQYYQLRLSASIYDAFSWHKKVFTTSLSHAHEFENKYPGICSYVSGPSDLLLQLEKDAFLNTNEDSFNRFVTEHSIPYVSAELKKTLAGIFC